jgi:hypothetical protein
MAWASLLQWIQRLIWSIKNPAAHLGTLSVQVRANRVLIYIKEITMILAWLVGLKFNLFLSLKIINADR